MGAGVVALGLYGFVATLQPDGRFGRVVAAYGGVFVVGSLAWGMIADGYRPDRDEPDLMPGERRGSRQARTAVQRSKSLRRIPTPGTRLNTSSAVSAIWGSCSGILLARSSTVSASWGSRSAIRVTSRDM